MTVVATPLSLDSSVRAIRNGSRNGIRCTS